MRKHDWADALARQIADDFLVTRPVPKIRFDLVAARLRVVREEGISAGLEMPVSATKGEPDAAS